MKSETVFHLFLTKLDFWNLWSFWWHLWDLWHWCQWLFSSCMKNSSQCRIFTWMNPTLWGIFQNVTNPALWGILKYTTSNNWKKNWRWCQKGWIFTWMNPTMWGIFQKLFKSCIVRNFKVVQVFLTKLDFWNLGRFWWHLWDLCQWCQWWFWSSLTKIPHNVAF